MADEAAGPTSFDVAVVGSGPAGMSAAAELAGSGMSVAVVERLGDAGFGRYHSTCGEAVSDGMLDRIGWHPSAVTARVGSISITSASGASISVPVSGCIVDRPAMLAELRSGCDAEFLRASVTDVSAADGGYRLALGDGRELSCRWLIGADGAHSVVRRRVFGVGPTESIPVVNCIVRGGSPPVLGFGVGGEYSGVYSWRFPSREGFSSVGFPSGHADPRTLDGLESWGARDLPFGVLDRVVDGGCLLVGDAACLANPLCYGGIGAAMLSGRRAAAAVSEGRPGDYQRWVSRSLMFDRHFMDAHRQFAGWGDAEIEDAMAPFARGYSVARGLYAMIRRPRYANVYMSVYMAFRLGW